MFADIDADIYVLADGDATYDAAAAPEMIQLLHRVRLDMVVGERVAGTTAAYRSGHRLGNRMPTGLLTRMFGQSFSDILSGYRVFSKRFVKSFPVRSNGFEIETEISVHARELAMRVAEEQTAYGARQEGSASKLATYSDGFRILRMMLHLYRCDWPIEFFGIIAGALALIGLSLAVPIFLTYFATGLVPRFPTAVLVVGIGIIAVLCLFIGIMLDTVTKGRGEVKRLIYLQNTPPHS